ncbi:DUF2325 domain-containing protein [Acidovorax sp. LjRoot129]|uniref:DUF2325 domain-containing protein n=1 Tax=Acidovorax sp. LjRoot129 TaxID=3342260 RepID=UPI003ECF326E
MHSLPQEFLAVCRQLGEAQQRCSATLAAQARQIEALTAEIVRLRGAIVLRDTRLGLAREELEQLKAATPGLPRRKAMARHIGVLAERIATLSRERLRWRHVGPSDKGGACTPDGAVEEGALAGDLAGRPTPTPTPTPSDLHLPTRAAVPPTPVDTALDAHLAAADLVICQTGCISHDQYWRVQDHCRRTGKPCILVDQPLAAREAEVWATLRPQVQLQMKPPQRSQGVESESAHPWF